ncbi:hypothetical protein CBF23_009925 [Marinomonas agarivorans]|nr:hypothetical protein CBF23_009925 [Marinomonas agarivorans]
MGNLKVAAISFSGVILGAVISVGGAWVNTSIQESGVESRHIREKQSKIISDMATILAQAGRTKGLVYGHYIQLAAAGQINKLCINGAIVGSPPKNCDLNKVNKQMNEFNKEIFQSTAKFQSVRSLANIYFCDKTQGSLAREPFATNWWEASNEQVANLLNNMRVEFGCRNL